MEGKYCGDEGKRAGDNTVPTTSGSGGAATTETSTEASSLETDLKSIINKLSPLLGPLPPGQSRKVKYEKGGTSVEIKVPIEDKDQIETDFNTDSTAETQSRRDQIRRGDERERISKDKERERASIDQRERANKEQKERVCNEQKERASIDQRAKEQDRARRGQMDREIAYRETNASKLEKERKARVPEKMTDASSSDCESSSIKTSNRTKSTMPTSDETSFATTTSITTDKKYSGDAKVTFKQPSGVCPLEGAVYRKGTYKPASNYDLTQNKRSSDPKAYEPEAKKVCPSFPQEEYPLGQAFPANIDRYNYNHIAYGRSKRKIKWSSYFPSIPNSIAMFSNASRSKNTIKKESSDESGLTVPQLYKANVGPGPFPNRFTFRAVTGGQDGFAEQGRGPIFPKMENSGEPYESRMYIPPQHYPRIATQPPYVKAGPCEPPKVSSRSNLGRTISSANKPDTSTPSVPKTFRGAPTQDPTSQQSIMQRICEDCQRHGEFARVNNMDAGLAHTGKEYEVNPEKARAFLGEKGEGYISVNTIPERVDVYCFDQLNTGFFRTSDHPPPLIADVAVETTEAIATRFWAELFGLVHIVFAFLIAMVLQFFKFLLTAIVRPLLIGVVQLFSDYFVKPLLTVIYNGFTQPISVCMYNVLASFRDIMNPVAKAIGFFFEPFANLIRSFRLVEVKHIYTAGPPYKPDPAAVPLINLPPSLRHNRDPF